MPTRLERVAASAIVRLLMLWLTFLGWDAIHPSWFRWPLLVVGMAGVVWWMSRLGPRDRQ